MWQRLRQLSTLINVRLYYNTRLDLALDLTHAATNHSDWSVILDTQHISLANGTLAIHGKATCQLIVVSIRFMVITSLFNCSYYQDYILFILLLILVMISIFPIDVFVWLTGYLAGREDYYNHSLCFDLPGSWAIQHLHITELWLVFLLWV